MPKAGSGFMRQAGNAGSAILQGRGSGFIVPDRRSAQDVAAFYARTYRNNDVTFEYDRAGRVRDINVSERFVERAEKLAGKLAREAVIRDTEAEREYNSLRSWVRRIRTSDAERREFNATYQRESHLNARPAKSMGDASEVAAQMAQKGLISHDIPRLGNNVDILTALHDAVNSAKSRMHTPTTMLGSGAVGDIQAEIFEGLTSRYEGVYKGAQKRRR